MIRMFGRLALALLGLLVLARAASAQEPVHAEIYGSAYGYEEGYASGSREARVYTEDRYGAREQRSGSGYERGYGYEYGARDGYERVRHAPEPRPCDWNRPRDPRDPYACPPGYGLVTLPASFFHGGGGVGPEYIASGGGGGGGYVYAGAAAGASAFAFASASASARVSIGGRRGGHHPGKKGGGGCGCR